MLQTNHFINNEAICSLSGKIQRLFGSGAVWDCFCECLSFAQNGETLLLEESRRKLRQEKDRFLAHQAVYIPAQVLRYEQAIQEAENMFNKMESIPAAGNNSKKVFLVHGRNMQMKKEIKAFFYEIGFEPIILSEQVNGGKTVIEKFEEYAEQAAFAVIMLSPDDEGGSRGQLPRPRARQNVILELGYFIGRLGRSKVLLFRPADEEFEEPSDISGYCFINYDSSEKWKLEAAKNIASMGYHIDLHKITMGE
ncbi:MAG: nucleotide-binding protein [Blautia sp.]|nr:nucleotide-binding protein [Blautia sp.]